MKTETQKNKKLRASILSCLLAIALLLTGTFAWRSMSQRTQNEIMDNRNPGGRVHDDFSYNEIAKNKDVYAENFTDKLDGAPIFVRIKLAEYMETGADAGVKRNETDRKATPLVYANINDTNTWKVFDPHDKDDPFRNFWDLSFGGQTVYLPTFNKNKDSLSVDVNGTYVGPNGKFDDEDRYEDYKTYEEGKGYTGTEYYDADDNDIDEYIKGGVGGPNGDGGILGTNYSIKADVEHVAVKTLPSLPGFVLMSEWVKAGKPVCNQWVYDDTADVTNGGGWFYWPEPILPQTATGLLLDNVSQRRTAGEKTYYAIDVTGQFATAFQWGDQGGKTDAAKGFYLNGFSDAAKELMDQAASVEIGKDDKWYLSNGNGVYQEILNDAGDLGDLVCAGEDKLIGTADDRTDVVYVKDGFTIGSTKYCEYYLKPTAAEPCYRASTPDNNLGTDTDARFWVISGEFPTGTLTTQPVTALAVTSKDNTDQVKQAETLQFTATLTVADGVTNKDVAWSVTGNEDKTGTSISDAGLLTVGNETVGTKLTVTATSKLDGRVSDSWEVTVVTDKTITLDGKEYYVLATDSANNRALVLAKNLQLQKAMDSTDEMTHWPQTELFQWLNNTETGWLGQNPELNSVSLLSTMKTRADYNATTWDSSTSKSFLLSEADVFGTFNSGEAQSDDYTYPAKGKLDAPSIGWGCETFGSTDCWWLRSPCTNSALAATVNGEGKFNGTQTNLANGYAVRPAAWVMLNGVNVTADDGTLRVAHGDKLQFNATVVKNMNPTADQTVTWKVTGGASGTSIDSNGLLTVSLDETARSLTVTATTADGVVGSTEIPVAQRYNLTVGENETFEVDGQIFRVLVKDDAKHQALILREHVLTAPQTFGKSNQWKNCSLRTYLNDTYLNTLSTLKESVKQTSITTRETFNSSTFITTKDHVFLLSEADVFGTTQEGQTASADDYTVSGSKQLFFSDSERVATRAEDPPEASSYWWLRSPARASNGVALVGLDGSCTCIGYTSSYNVRPAMWISIQ